MERLTRQLELQDSSVNLWRRHFRPMENPTGACQAPDSVLDRHGSADSAVDRGWFCPDG